MTAAAVASPPTAAPPRGNMLTAWAWGLYLGASWTWCIAMFLPVILVSDAGPGAWPILLVCNVGGVAILPWVFRARRDSRAFVTENAAACRVFSVVTMLCQGWFMGWAASRMPWPHAAAALAAVAALAAIGRSRPLWLAAALACCLATAAAAVSAAAPAQFTRTLTEEFAWHPMALYSLPLVFAGFLSSPQFDLTFHHALRASPAPRQTFMVAFPLVFGAMLLASLAWRDVLAPWMLTPPHAATGAAAPAWLLAVLAAIVVQVGFTLVLHARHLPARLGGISLAAAVAAAALAGLLGDLGLPGPVRTLNALVYRSSIGFYGVVVPCYLWAAAIPRRTFGPAAIALTLGALLVSAIPMLLEPRWLPLYPCAFGLIVLTRFATRPRTPAPAPA